MSVSDACFNCNAKVEKDAYGLTQCSSCQTLIFVDFDGHVQRPPKDEIAEEQNTSDSLSQIKAEDHQNVEEQEPSSSYPTSFDESFQTEPSLENQNKKTNELEALKDSSHKSSSFQEVLNPMDDEQGPQADFDTSQDNFSTDISSQKTNDPPKESHFEDLESKDDIYESEKEDEGHQQIDSNNKPLQDVVDYANSPEDLDLGGFYYNIVISGIDSKNLRQSVLEALDDNRLGWGKKEEIDSLIKNGCLIVKKVNAAKTYILISYLKFLPVKVKWDQVSLTKSHHDERSIN